jgi:hypothetical protein
VHDYPADGQYNHAAQDSARGINEIQGVAAGVEPGGEFEGRINIDEYHGENENEHQQVDVGAFSVQEFGYFLQHNPPNFLGVQR